MNGPQMLLNENRVLSTSTTVSSTIKAIVKGRMISLPAPGDGGKFLCFCGNHYSKKGHYLNHVATCPMVPGGPFDVDRVNKEEFVQLLKSIDVHVVQFYSDAATVKTSFLCPACKGEYSDLVDHLEEEHNVLMDKATQDALDAAFINCMNPTSVFHRDISTTMELMEFIGCAHCLHTVLDPSGHKKHMRKKHRGVKTPPMHVYGISAAVNPKRPAYIRFHNDAVIEAVAMRRAVMATIPEYVGHNVNIDDNRAHFIHRLGLLLPKETSDGLPDGKRFVPEHIQSLWKTRLSDMTKSMSRAPIELRGMFNKCKLHSPLQGEGTLKGYCMFWTRLLSFAWEYVSNFCSTEEYDSILRKFEVFRESPTTENLIVLLERVLFESSFGAVQKFTILEKFLLLRL